MAIGAYQLFQEALINDFTRRNYTTHFNQFLKWTGKNADDLIKPEARELEDLIHSYQQHLEKEGYAKGSINAKLSAIQRFYVQNRVNLNWNWIRSFKTRANGKVKDRDYNREELRKILDAGDIRQKAILLTLLTGMRKGGIASHYTDATGNKIDTGLRIRNLQKITSFIDDEGNEQPLDSHLYKITVYEGEPEEYFCFTTFEGAQAIDAYLDKRRRDGETLTPDSWLFRQEYNKKDVDNVKPLTRDALTQLFVRLTRDAGVRTKGEKYKRKETMLFHACRKFVNSRMVERKVDYVAKEYLLGHRQGLEPSYLRSQENNFLKEWLKAIPVVTVSNEKQLQQHIEKLQVQVGDIDVYKRSYLDTKAELDRLRAEQERKEKDMPSMIQAEVEKAVARVMQLRQENPILDNVKLEALAKKKREGV